MYCRRVLLVLGLAASVHAENAFRRPPGAGENRDYRDNPTYDLGDELDILWEVDFNQSTVLIQQQDVDDSLDDQFTAEIITNTTKETYSWKISFDDFSADFDKTASNVFFFRLLDDSGAEDEITSHYFNITDASESTTTSEAPTATSTEAAAAAATTAEESTGLSRTGLVGVSIGATIGGMTLIGSIFGFILWKLLRRRGYGPPPPHMHHEQPMSPPQTKPEIAMSPSSMTTSTVVPPPTQHYYHELHQQQHHYQPPHELSHSRIHEAPS
ncbi:hypothetical protein QQX98_011722 [Neonectria punicea]|uniref:Mid2 domain-containing protein n=1 Tax=Neonectria punicea TaxID=979145 RepID=A0ABR1GL86_9HYPO